MVSLLVVIWTALFLVASLAFRRYVRKVSKFPPGNIGWPLLGETLSLVQPHAITSRGDFLDKHIAKFGTIFSSNLIGKCWIVSADPELNKFILKNDGIMFETDWPRNIKKFMSKVSLGFLAGEEHKHMRSVTMDFLSSEKLRTVFLEESEQLASELLSSWKDSAVISAIDEANKFAFHFAMRQIIRLDCGVPTIERLRTEYGTFARGVFAIPLYLPGTAYWKAFKSRAYIVSFLKQMIEERISMESKYGEGIGGGDFLSCVMKNTNHSVTDISELLLSFIFAGHHTTSKSISSMIYFLHGCPKAVQQLREEHSELIRTNNLKGKTTLTLEDYHAMKFTKCVINEILRLSNVAPLIFRKSTTNFYFKDYFFPQGSSFIMHMLGMHLDSTLFEDPQHFNPWRWMCPSGAHKIDAFKPFGGGVRLCPGNMLARLQMTIFLHTLLEKYDWELVEPYHPISTPTIEFVKGLNIKVHPL